MLGGVFFWAGAEHFLPVPGDRRVPSRTGFPAPRPLLAAGAVLEIVAGFYLAMGIGTAYADTASLRGVQADVLEQVVREHMEALEPCTTHCAARRRVELSGARCARPTVTPALCDDDDYERREKRTNVGRGNQYCSIEFQAELGIRISMVGKQLSCDGRYVLQDIEIRADLALRLQNERPIVKFANGSRASSSRPRSAWRRALRAANAGSGVRRRKASRNLGACLSSHWIFRDGSGFIPGHEQALSPVEDR